MIACILVWATWAAGTTSPLPATIPTSHGAYRISVDRSYYVDWGHARGATASGPVVYRSTGDVDAFYIPTAANSSGPLSVDAGRLEGFDPVAIESLRADWMQAIRIQSEDGWTLIPVNYMQGLVYGDQWMDVSPGIPTSVETGVLPGMTRVTLQFDRPIYHLFRAGADFVTDELDGLYSATLVVTFTDDPPAVFVDHTVSLDRPIYHHNGFYFAGFDPGSDRYNVRCGDTELNIPVHKEDLPFTYLQASTNPGIRLVQHGTTPDRPHDEGPYIEVGGVERWPRYLEVETERHRVRLSTGTYPDLAYTRTYMDMFGTKFPRNAIIMNYRQFGEPDCRIAMLLSYTGLGMGWIPALLLPGRYRMAYSVVPLDDASNLAGVSFGDGAPPTPARRDSSPAVPVNRELVRYISESANRRTPAWKRLIEAFHRREVSPEAIAAARELQRHWEARQWRDWRGRWLRREWVDWPHYWGRTDPGELSWLILETLALARELDDERAAELSGIACRVWLDEVWNDTSFQRWRHETASGGVARALVDFELASTLAAAFELACADPSWFRTNGRAGLAVLNDILFQYDQPRTPSYTPTNRIERLRRLNRGISRYYYTLILNRIDLTVPSRTVTRTVTGLTEAVEGVEVEDFRCAPEWIRSLACREVLEAVDLVGPNLLDQLVSLSHPKDPPWHAVRTPVQFPTPGGYVYFPWTTYGRHDLHMAICAYRGGNRDAVLRTAPLDRTAGETHSVFAMALLASLARR